MTPTNGPQTVDGPGAPAQSPSGGAGAWRIVTLREITARLTDRNFLISTGVTLVIMIAAVSVQAFLAARTSTSTVAVVDSAAARIVQAAPGQADAAGAGVPDAVQARTYPDAAAARQAVLDGSADAWLHREGGTWVLSGKEGTPNSGLLAAVQPAVRNTALADNALAAGTTVTALQKGTTLRTDALVPVADPAEEGIHRAAGFVFAFLFYVASLMFGMAIATSVVEEKQSRIVEILATVIPVRQLLLGKVLGNTALALGQMVLFVGVGLIGLSFTPVTSVIPSLVGVSAWFLVFFVVGFLALACIWAAAGSLASRTEDLQATTSPLTMLIMGVFFAALWSNGTWQVVMSYLPIASSIAMPTRLLAGTAQWWEPVVALAVTLVFASLMVLVGERIYRRALLQTQGRVTIRQALRTAD